MPTAAARMVGSKESIKVAGRVESVDISQNMILVATSNLGGNTWDSSLQVLDFSTKEVVASVKQQSGCADVCWIKPGRRAVSAGDSGDVKVRRKSLVASDLEVDAPRTRCRLLYASYPAAELSRRRCFPRTPLLYA